MRKPITKSNTPDLKTQLLQQAQKATEFFKESGYASEFADELMPSIRAEAIPPTQPEKSRFNPDQIVDIITFIEHPFFCNLKPYPWQKLILKCFYMGQEGNTNLNIEDHVNDTDCKGCVWEYIKDNEENFYKSRKENKQFRTIFSITNSPCVQCKRQNKDVKYERYHQAKEESTNPDAERLVAELEKRPIIDCFQSEKDLLYSEEFDPKLRMQVEDKCTKRYKFQELVLVLGRRSGKLTRLDTPLYTMGGWSTMGDVKVGDYVFAPDGTPTKVVAKSDVDYNEQAYELVFSNGDRIVAGENHEWVTLTKAQRKNASRGKYSKDPVPQVFTTKQIYESLTYGKPRQMLKKGSQTERNEKFSVEYNHAIEITKPLQFPEQDLFIHPYLLGVWLGDGSNNSGQIAGIDIEIFDYIESNCNHSIKHSEYNQTCHYINPNNESDKIFLHLIKEIGVFKNKHIPLIYKQASIEQRLELLRGLNDTDGYVDPKKYTVEFCNTNETLAYDYYELVCGLGFKASIKKSDAKLYGRKTSDRWRITYSVRPGDKVFNLPRKQSVLDSKKTVDKSDKYRVFIKECNPVHNTGMQCIQVEHPSHMYLIGQSMIPTHNSFLVSAMALYELYRLISMGHPQSRYGLMEFDEIVLLNVARNEEQAKKAIFSKIKQTVLASPFFSPYIGKDTELEMRFYTQHDREENERRKSQNLNPFSGSLVLRCGSSNASGLVGLTCWCIIMDEVAAMAGDNPDSGVDYSLYDDLKPSLATFGKDGKMMMLSNPKGPIGLLYDLHENRQEDATTLVMRLPTWLTNPNIDKAWLDDQKKKNPTEHQMQYGAEFGASSSDPMFMKDDIDRMFSSMSMVKRVEQGQQLFEYYCHLDPARTSDYYALVVAHTEMMNGLYGPDNLPLKRVVIDHIHFWNPLTKNQPVSERDVEEYVIELHKRFKFRQVSIDQWHSQSSIIKLQSYGINIQERQFNKEYKEKIYTELSQLIREDRIDIYDLPGGTYIDSYGTSISLNEIQEAKTQFLFLQKKWKGKRYYIEALSGYKDDICDAVAAVSYECLTSKFAVRLPKSKLANLGGRFR